MTASGRGSSTFTPTKRQGQALLTAALLSEVMSGGQAFSTPVGVTSLQRVNRNDDKSPVVPKSEKSAVRALFANQYYNDEDQWEDSVDYNEYEGQQQQQQQNEFDLQQFDPRNYEGKKRAILGGAALGTMMAINNAVGMNAVAETVAPEPAMPTQQVSAQSYSSVSYAAPEASLPYLEKQIQEAEAALQSTSSYVSSAESVTGTTSTVASAGASSTSETTAQFAPSFIRYTQERMPGWIETGQKVYDAASPKIVAGGQKIAAEVDKRVMPTVVATEHELLGEANSAVLDKTLSTAASAGKMMAGMLGKVAKFGFQGTVAVVKATPDAIHAAQEMYKTVDQKIVPEVVATSQKMQKIVDKTMPEVMDTGKHAYDTIMPEFVSAERQVAGAVQNGMDKAMPVMKDINKKVAPELNKIERGLLGDQQAAAFDRAVADAAKQTEDLYRSAEKTIPQVLDAGQKTVDGVAYTGRTVAKAVPLILESGMQTANAVDRSINDAISTTKDIAADLDRAAGKTAYVVEGSLNTVTGTIDKTLPHVLEAGRQVAETSQQLAQTAEYVAQDIADFVDDVKLDNTINSASKRYASTKPTIQEMTTSAFNPNQNKNL